MGYYSAKKALWGLLLLALAIAIAAFVLVFTYNTGKCGPRGPQGCPGEVGKRGPRGKRGPGVSEERVEQELTSGSEFPSPTSIFAQSPGDTIMVGDPPLPLELTVDRVGHVVTITWPQMLLSINQGTTSLVLQTPPHFVPDHLLPGPNSVSGTFVTGSDIGVVKVIGATGTNPGSVQWLAPGGGNWPTSPTLIPIASGSISYTIESASWC